MMPRYHGFRSLRHDLCKRRLQARLEGGALGFDLSWMNDDLVIRKDVPGWFSANGNMLFAPANAKTPVIEHHDGRPYSTDALIVLGINAAVARMVIWGTGATVAMASGTNLPNGSVYCGDGSLIYIGKDTYASVFAELNARNNGLIHVEGDGLWSAGVRLLTDDMHAIRDVETGARINAFGGRVLVHKHVWLGLEVLLLGGADVGQDSVVGTRSVVTGVLPSNTVSVGVPARPVRQGITWSRDDDP